MKNSVTRRSFIKGTAAGTLGLMAAGLGIPVFAETKGMYTPGTYSATVQGMGDVKVSMTFSADAITEVIVDTANETAGIGLDLGKQYAQQIMDMQAVQFDAVSGATVTSDAVRKAAEACVAQAKGETVDAGSVDMSSENDADWLGNAPEIADIAQSIDVDVVVVGAGLAGVCAARAAAEEGASVAIIEKGESFNCRSGEYAVLNGSLNERWGRKGIVDVDVVVNRLMRECTYRNKRSILKKWADHAHEAMDWFIGAYPEMTICDTTRQAVTKDQFDKGILVPLAWPQPEHYDYRNEEFPTFPSSMEFRSSRRDQQGFVVEANLNKAIENGAKTYFGCFGTKLLKNEEGRVTGLIVRDAKANVYMQFNAAKGVILATGDNGGDEKLIRHFCPEIIEKNIKSLGMIGMMGKDVEGNPCPTGDGLRMGAWIGAKVQDFHAPMTHHMGSGMGITPFLQLNKHGMRFMNECIPGQQLENQIELQPDQTTYQIYDSKWPEQIPYMPANHGGLCYIIPEDEDESNPNFNDRQYTKVSAKAEAHQFKADTLEELFALIGYEGKALENAKASVERYNRLCREGYDADFGKPAGRMFPIEKGPFYACTWNPTILLVCVGGLESDENCHTFTGTASDPARDLIPGLYVAGNVQGSRYAVEYPICFRGISHSLCLYYGYVAGKNCVAGI